MKLYTTDNQFIKEAIKQPPGFTGIVEYTDSSRAWYLNGILHREDGPAFISANYEEYWYFKGKRHREDGPAIIYAVGAKFWYLHGQKHRINGPAAEYPNGTKIWFLYDKEYNEQEYKLLMDLLKLKGIQ